MFVLGNLIYDIYIHYLYKSKKIDVIKMNIVFLQYKDHVTPKKRAENLQDIAKVMKDSPKDGTLLINNNLLKDIIVENDIDDIKEYKTT